MEIVTPRKNHDQTRRKMKHELELQEHRHLEMGPVGQKPRPLRICF